MNWWKRFICDRDPDDVPRMRAAEPLHTGHFLEFDGDMICRSTNIIHTVAAEDIDAGDFVYFDDNGHARKYHGRG